jgi:acetyltransferase-like isoleucine patch superfamily enzyme
MADDDLTASPGAVADKARSADHRAGRARAVVRRGPTPARGQPARAATTRAPHRPIGDRVSLAEGAAVVCSALTIGDRSYVAAGCLLRDRVTIGQDCSINPHVTMAGSVTFGDGVRVASHAAFFFQPYDDLDTPIWLQGLTEQGITVGDDVWIGTHVVVCDGVTVGAHSVVAAGAVVTRDVPPYSVVSGVPARVVRDRRDATPDRAGTGTGRRRLVRSTGSTRWRQWPGWSSGAGHGHRRRSPRHPGGRARRAHPRRVTPSDRRGSAPPPLEATVGQRPVARLQATGPGHWPVLDPVEGCPDDPLQWQIGAEYHHYGVLSVGYALELLDASPRHPVRCVADATADELLARLDALPWRELAWPAGSWVDFWGTAVYLNRRHHGGTAGLDVVRWLRTHLDRRSGMWGGPHRDWGWLMPVNGFYRLTRGTYAQFGEPVDEPEAVIDTVVAHCRDHRWFVERGRTACNVLDVVHPLWLCARQTDYRRPELRDQLAALLERTVGHWVDGAGFAFEDGAAPGLQGTEMWLAIIHLIADQLTAHGLSFTPQGVHRLEQPRVDSLHSPAVTR